MSFVLSSRPYSHAEAPITTRVSAVIISTKCAKCGTNKAGKRSCCARGGSWFKNCGDTGDTQFDHTWIDGIQACKSKSLRDGIVTGTMPLIVLLIITNGMLPSYTQRQLLGGALILTPAPLHRSNDDKECIRHK